VSEPRILHLFANFKWTGPADPAIRCALAQRRVGADVVFAQAAWTLPGAEHRMAIELARVGMPVIGDLELRKHFHVRSHLRDARRLRARLERGDFDVVHAHLPADHLIAALARRRSRRAVVLVRSLYEPAAPPARWRSRVAFRETDGVVVPTVAAAVSVSERYGMQRERILVQDPPTEPASRRADGDLRDRLGLGRGDLAIGVTARIQPHRRFELLWEIAQRVVAAEPRARFVLLGRGNAEDTARLVRTPVERLGLGPWVVLPGYLYEPEYSRALRSLDVFLFLVPGSDGTCRAVREAMSFGLPVVTTRRGMLPELVGSAGIACDEDPADLARALLDLLADPVRRASLGGAALDRVHGAMDPERAARELLGFYRLLETRPRRGRGRLR
jgi:glycosyltransferase involved in cell wall biosynthesis